MNLNFRRNILRIIKIKPPPKTGKVNDTKKVGGKIDIMEKERILGEEEGKIKLRGKGTIKT